MAYGSYEKLEVWQRSCKLAVEIYGLLKNCTEYGLKNQMTKSAVSIASNIAEGSERGTPLDYIRFLRIAKGSSAELCTQIYIASEIGMICPKTKANELIGQLKEISSMLQGLINSLQIK